MNYFTLKLALLIILLSNIECFANTTTYIAEISKPYTSHIIIKTPNVLIHEHITNDLLPIKNSNLLTMSILEFIKEHTDPYKRKNEAQGSWIKSTKWIKDPSWIKKELV